MAQCMIVSIAHVLPVYSNHRTNKPKLVDVYLEMTVHNTARGVGDGKQYYCNLGYSSHARDTIYVEQNQTSGESISVLTRIRWVFQSTELDGLHVWEQIDLINQS